MAAGETTFTDLHDSSDLVWELLCQVEDGAEIDGAIIAGLSTGDQLIFAEEIAHMELKGAKAAAKVQAVIDLAAEREGRLAADRAWSALMPWERPGYSAQVEAARAVAA